MNESLNITPVSWQTEKAVLMAIREQVFIIEQQVPVADEWDDKDDTAIHFLARNSAGVAIGCARLLIEKQSHQTLFHIGRVAVLMEYRKQECGRKLMQEIVRWCLHENSRAKIYLNAQITKQQFYEYLHFHAKGPIFMDAGIPHIEMWYQP